MQPVSLSTRWLQVAEVLVEAVLQPRASGKVVEVVESKSAPQLPVDQWFANL